MGKFNVCARVARQAGPQPSYAWIALHQCIEANARLTGEPFRSIFGRLMAAHAFGRGPRTWPDGQKIRDAIAQLTAEREAFLAELSAREAARRAAKRRGVRSNDDPRLAEMTQRQREHVVPRVGAWGWRARAGQR